MKKFIYGYIIGSTIGYIVGEYLVKTEICLKLLNLKNRGVV